MLINYSAIDGYSIGEGSVIATLMGDAASNMVSDRVNSSPLNTLTENGTITYSVTSDNATTLWATNFSTVNYYSLPYISGLDPSTNGFSIKIWFYNSGAGGSTKRLIIRDSAVSAQSFEVTLNSSGYLYCSVDDNTTTRTVSSVNALDDGKKRCAVFTFDGTNLKMYLNGTYHKVATGTTLLTLSNASAVLHIGRNIAANTPFTTGGIAGVEIEIGRVWTAQEIKNKYDREKVLFEQNELFSIVGQQMVYELNVHDGNPSYTVDNRFTESLDGKRAGYTNRRKKTYSCSVVPFLEADLPAALKFLKSVDNYRSFTFDRKGSLSSSPNYVDPVPVYKTSSNEVVSFSNPFYSYSFSVMES